MRRSITRSLPVLCAAAGLAALMSCTAVRQVRPLAPGENVVNLSLGGPMTKYIGDAFLPLPLLSVGYNRGLTESLDLEAGIDLTHTLFSNPKIDAGVNWRLQQAERWHPAVTVSPRLHFVSDFKTAARLYPALSMTWAWQAGTSLYPYLGMENFFELQRERDDGQPQTHHWLIAPYAGLALCRGRWQYQLEVRVYTPNLDNDRAVENLGFGDHGILGFFLGIGRAFGRTSLEVFPTE
jgi:hypothetical protein